MTLGLEDYLKMKVGEIRHVLVENFGLDKGYVDNVKGKAALIALVEEALQSIEDTSNYVDQIDFGDKDSTGDFEEVSAKNPTWDDPDSNVPKITEVGWHDYVMKQFSDDELIKGNPTVDGMRRVAAKLIGPIDSIITQIVQTPQPPDQRATAIVRVVIEGNSYDGAADSYYGNTADKPYRYYPVSIAETRAEGRAFKKILGLRKVNSAEELGQIQDDEENVEDGPITDAQLRFFDIMCNKDRLNINVEKFITNEGFNKTTLTHKDSLKLQEKLSVYQTKAEDIPDLINNYDPNWRTNS